MSRIKGGVTAQKRHKKILKLAKGYRGARSRTFRIANQAVIKAGQYAYRDRKQRKRVFRSLWIVRINAAARLFEMSYSQFMHGLKLAEVVMDRKMLAELAANHPESFAEVARVAKEALQTTPAE